jgi:hypothetical protein
VNHRVQLVVAIRSVRALSVVHADTEDTVVAGAFQPRLDQIGVALFDLLRCPVKEHTEIAFIAHG